MLSQVQIHEEPSSWWYPYVSEGNDVLIPTIRPVDLTVSSRKKKLTPRFDEYLYDSCVCHSQIGENLSPNESIVVLKTTVGMRHAPSGFVEKVVVSPGYFKVERIENGFVHMDPKESVLLLEDPIVLNSKVAQTLFPEVKGFKLSDDIVRKLGSMTRHAKIGGDALNFLVSRFDERIRSGSKNYMGAAYTRLSPPAQRFAWQGSPDFVGIVNSALDYLKAHRGKLFTKKQLYKILGLKICEADRPVITTLLARRLITKQRQGQTYRYSYTG